MHHHRQRRCAIPVIGQQDIIFTVADLAGDITAAGLGGGRGSEENTEEKQKYKVSHQRGSQRGFKISECANELESRLEAVVVGGGVGVVIAKKFHGTK
jgi:hypothetical protein